MPEETESVEDTSKDTNSPESSEPKGSSKLMYLGLLIFIIAAVVLVYYLIINGNKQNAMNNNLQIPTSEALSGVQTPTASSLPEASPPEDFSKYAGTSKLVIEDKMVGTGAAIKSGDTAVVHYTGYLTDGTLFDSSKKSGNPFAFEVGAGEVIAGWEEGLIGMKVAGVRRLIIPPAMGYGNQAAGSIPANSILIFDIELQKIE